MLVEIDGEIVERPIDRMEYSSSFTFGVNSLPQANIYMTVPVLNRDEELVWRIGNPIPLIIKTGA